VGERITIGGRAGIVRDVVRKGNPRGPGSRGNRLPAAMKLERDRGVGSDRNRGFSWPEVARRSGLGERQCREVYRLWREQHQEDLLTADPVAAAVETLAAYDGLLNELALAAENADNANAVVGALKAQAAVLGQRVELLQAIGVLPRALGELRLHADVQLTARRILQVFEEHGVPEETKQAVAAALLPGG
jgi:hypothetical protein